MFLTYFINKHPIGDIFVADYLKTKNKRQKILHNVGTSFNFCSKQFDSY